MDKVLIDRELLEKHISEIDSWNSNMEKIIGKQPGYSWTSLESLREALVQPAEAEGASGFQIARHSKRLVEQLRSDLSAVTAERDQSISLTADYIAMLGEAGLQIDQLTAERDALAARLGEWERSKLAQIMRENVELTAERDSLRAQLTEQPTFTVGTDLSDGKLTVVVMKHENDISWVIHSEVIQLSEQQPTEKSHLIGISDYRALQAKLDDMERDYLTIIEAQDAEHRKQVARLQAECERLRK